MLKRLIQDIRDGKVSVDQAMKLLKLLPYEEMDNILLDHHRYLRKGFPEVVYGPGKSIRQLKDIVSTFLEQKVPILITRIDEQKAQGLCRQVPAMRYDHVARAVYHPGSKNNPIDENQKNEEKVLVVTAGTSDLPVAREATLTLRLMGIGHEELIDVGVAGIHRLFSHIRRLQSSSVIICIAGMEGALPSIVAGLVRCPVIAVPTSTGYGSNLNGIVPLLAMLNSCAPGIGVVNIDNGFGAAALAASILWS